MGILKLFRKMNSLECKGLCIDSCGPTHPSKRETQDIREYCEENQIPFHNLADIARELKAKFLLGLDPYCPFLKEDRCSIYEVRPMVCRLWRATEAMPPCIFGCEPKRGFLTRKEGYRLADYAKEKGLTILRRPEFAR